VTYEQVFKFQEPQAHL